MQVFNITVDVGFDHKPAPFISLRPINDSFQNKLLDLQRPIRIGRQVSADTAPTETNGYFSNKVLSRNHAELWYERGKILIKDVKSSNGTFLNGKRLSGENMESPVFEVVDGDKIEFGVDFLGENNVGE
ncbi:SMAD/FHA domain-containing protein [Syncephalis plumigaleata]|nr:SMAD/FHA domain-containing protein [Syncephalis plumigaleata]